MALTFPGLDQFEALALSQQPASQPWTPVTDYSFEARKEIEGQHPRLIKDVLKPVDVLDVGCGESAILVRLLDELGVSANGVDINFTYENEVWSTADVSSRRMWSDCVLSQQRWDVVICREVLEHLTLLGIRNAVENLCHHSARLVYVTTRFSSEHDLLRVETSDDLDPTHITIPSKDLLRLLFVLEGFTRRDDLETKMDWQHKGRCLVYERAV